MNIYLVEKMGLEVTEYPYMKPAEMNYHEYIDIKKLIVKPGYLRLH
jgi:hypothetical protein